MSLTHNEYDQKMTTLLQIAEELARQHLKTHPTEPTKVRVGWFRHETASELSSITFTFNQDGESELMWPLYVTDKGKLVYWEGSRRRRLRFLNHDDTPWWTLENIIYDLKRGYSPGPSV